MTFVYDADLIEKAVERVGGLMDGDDGGKVVDVGGDAKGTDEFEGGGGIQPTGGAE